MVSAQQPGYLTAEKHPQLTIQQCQTGGACSPEQGEVVLDGNWRWTHKVGEPTNCFSGNLWNTSLCPDGKTCAANCALDGADYEGTYGIQSDGTTLNLKFVTNGAYSKNVGSRTYYMDSPSTYKKWKLKNREFTFDVDVSNLPCGLNGALYFVEMDKDGGLSKFPSNKAGAKYGTGYCDAQCPQDIKFINGIGNVEGWNPSPTNPNAGQGNMGTCCIEMDIWESNSQATAYTPHACSVQGQTMCTGADCGNGDGQRYSGKCDKDGCDFNSYRMGDKTFFGNTSSFKIDTTQKMTVVTQFITSDNTDTGDLVEIRRVYVQNGVVVNNSFSTFSGLTQYDSVSDKFCSAQKQLFGDKDDFANKGGLKAMGDSLDRGVVLVMSLWDDYAVDMLWLDSDYPPTKPSTAPGVGRGPCSTSSGKPSDVESNYPDSSVAYGNIKYGAIGSTYPSGGGGGGTYKCVNNQCVETAGGVSKSICEQVCTPAT
eukprot:CAMPEP_0175126806 /NCGR_PEP_ID=MMETSP0087-20121206/4056_1 /TAXON_ID=136419 /ORGANISM="Unknown Unknown, Strain D1" /LENGTH=481 /DNA_ID=CAMNT_0016408755 /DNA_START=58 /DNA_END=1500 /DNA_ORIENTATION=-